MTASSPKEPETNLPALASPARRALANAGIQRLEQLADYREDEIRQLHGIGQTALNQLRRALDENGLAFAQKAE